MGTPFLDKAPVCDERNPTKVGKRSTLTPKSSEVKQTGNIWARRLHCRQFDLKGSDEMSISTKKQEVSAMVSSPFYRTPIRDTAPLAIMAEPTATPNRERPRTRAVTVLQGVLGRISLDDSERKKNMEVVENVSGDCKFA